MSEENKVKKITELTEEQKARIPSWVDEWIQKGLKCGPADRERFEWGIRECYKYAGLNGDDLEIIWVESPIKAVTEGPLKAAKLDGKSDEEIKKNEKQIIKENWYKYIGGQGWISRVAYTTFYKDVCNLDLEGDLWDRNEAYTAILESAWWCWPHEQFVMVSERPVEIHLDENKRLHYDNGKAIYWPKDPDRKDSNGWGVYAWHGTNVPERLIMEPETYTAKEIRSIDNTEIVRALAEKLGWERYLEKIGTTKIDEYTDSKTGLKYELLESKNRVGEFEPRYIRKQSSLLKDGTQPWYIEPVHPELKTAAAARKFQAMASFVDNDENEYRILMEECNKNPELDYDWER